MDEWAGDFDGGSRECVSRVRVGCGGCRGSRGQGGGGKMKIWVRIITPDCYDMPGMFWIDMDWFLQQYGLGLF